MSEWDEMESAFREDLEYIGEEIRLRETGGNRTQPTPIYDGWVRLLEETGRSLWICRQRGAVRLASTCVELDPYEIKDHVAFRDWYYHVWNGDRRVLVTRVWYEALERYCKEAGLPVHYPNGADSWEENIRRRVERIRANGGNA